MRCKPEEGWGRLHQEFFGFPGGSDDKESACSAGDLGLILGSGRSPGEGNGNPLQYSCQEGLLKDKPTATRVGGRAGPMSPQSRATSSGRALGGLEAGERVSVHRGGKAAGWHPWQGTMWPWASPLCSGSPMVTELSFWPLSRTPG